MNYRGYSVAEFCNIYGVSRSTFYKHLNETKILARKCGRRTIIRHEEAERWFDALPLYRTKHSKLSWITLRFGRP